MVCHKILRTAPALIAAVSMGWPIIGKTEPLARSPVKCTPDSPEREGLEGCSILTSRPLSGPTDRPLFWHIGRYGSLDAARKAAGPNSVAAAAHGAFWLMTVAPLGHRPKGGRQKAAIGPLNVAAGQQYIMRVQSSLLLPGGGTPVHTHSGPEVFYVVSGTQCVETQSQPHRLTAGRSLVLPADTVHRGRVLGAAPRAALALVLHDATRPASNDLAAPPRLKACE